VSCRVRLSGTTGTAITFDYYDYGMDRVARLHANVARPEGPDWLEAV
jgi:hypothetical protein